MHVMQEANWGYLSDETTKLTLELPPQDNVCTLPSHNKECFSSSSHCDNIVRMQH